MHKKLLLALLILGLALRFAAVLARPDGAVSIAPDEDEFLQIAQSIARGEGFALRGVTTAYRDMLVPSLYGGLIVLFGESPLPSQLFNVLISTATAILLYLLGRRRFTESVAVFMAGIWLLYPTAIIMSATLFTETIFLFLWTLGLVLYDRLEERRFETRTAAWLGVVSGLTTLARGVGIIFPAALVLYIVFIRFETPRPLRLRAAATLTAAFLLVIVPWMTRNWMAVGRFALNTNGGINMYIGHNARANGSYLFDADHEKFLPPASAGEAARDIAAAQLAWAYVREHPGDALTMLSKKFAFLWATDMTQWVHYDWDPHGVPSVSGRLRTMPVPKLMLLGLPYVMIALFGISGFYLVRHFPARGLYLLLTFLVILMVFVTYGTPRYRLPLMPLLIIGIGALFRPKVWVSAPPWRRLFLLFTLGMLCGIWVFEVMTIAGV